MIPALVILSQYTRVTDDRQTTYYDISRILQCSCNVRLSKTEAVVNLVNCAVNYIRRTLIAILRTICHSSEFLTNDGCAIDRSYVGLAKHKFTVRHRLRHFTAQY